MRKRKSWYYKCSPTAAGLTKTPTRSPWWSKNFIVPLVFLSTWFLGFVATAHTNAYTCDRQDLIGRWQFYKFIYNNKEHPPITRNLVLQYEFGENNTSYLLWYKEGEKGFCERKGQYLYKDCFVLDKVTWVNPNNTVGCSQDPDMRLGRQTITRADLVNGEMRLHLSLKGEPFIYVWRRLPSTP